MTGRRCRPSRLKAEGLRREGSPTLPAARSSQLGQNAALLVRLMPAASEPPPAFADPMPELISRLRGATTKQKNRSQTYDQKHRQRGINVMKLNRTSNPDHSAEEGAAAEPYGMGSLIRPERVIHLSPSNRLPATGRPAGGLPAPPASVPGLSPFPAPLSGPRFGGTAPGRSGRIRCSPAGRTPWPGGSRGGSR